MGFNCRRAGEKKYGENKVVIVHIPHHRPLGVGASYRAVRDATPGQSARWAAGILQSSMVAQRLPRKLHIMPLCPIRKFFNYTFIAFVDASWSANEFQWLLGIEHKQLERETIETNERIEVEDLSLWRRLAQ